ncbi:MAG: alanine--glyoxylate aminotransferase family protein [Armatimonadota bacterium]|nr:alanine--glyoxylate aminotransferase family protein [Armatimonadota bacterium]MDW8156485.1 alanine--glyoxylate aminotransferase family protein [Armatimonadota bacterium]
MDELLLIPGPTPVPAPVREAGSRPMTNHRSEAFARVLRTVLQGVQELYRTRQPVVPYASSGTGVLEAAVVNTLSPGDRVLALSCGAFGNRFSRIARAYGAEITHVEVEWGTGIPPELLEDHLKRADYRAVLVTHNETSTGVQNDLEGLARARADRPTLLLVDAVSSLGAIPVDMDGWGLDVVVTASQKALGCPPGVSFLAASEQAWEAYRQARMPRYYWDMGLVVEALRQPLAQTPFTPAVSVFYSLEASLELLRREGYEAACQRHRLLSEAVRAGVRALGLRPVAAERWASWTVTAVWLPEGVSADALTARVRERYGVVLAGGQGKLEGKVFRIGHLGYVWPQDILRCMEALGSVLQEMGVSVDARAGVEAAQQVFEARAVV